MQAQVHHAVRSHVQTVQTSCQQTGQGMQAVCGHLAASGLLRAVMLSDAALRAWLQDQACIITPVSDPAGLAGVQLPPAHACCWTPAESDCAGQARAATPPRCCGWSSHAWALQQSLRTQRVPLCCTG